MPKEILVNVTSREVRIALLDNELEKGILQDIYIERSLQQGLVGNIYKGRVSGLLPGIQAAFIDIGLLRSAFLHVSDIVGYDQLLNQLGSATEIDIRDLLNIGQDILVQVYKDPLGSKGARLTTQFTIPSRYLVFTPKHYHIVVSQKITDEIERERLMSMILPSQEGGYIIRTAAEGVGQAEIDADKTWLEGLWNEIKARVHDTKPCKMIYEEIPIVLKILRDLAGYDVERIRVDSEKTVQKMRDYATRYVPHLASKIECYVDKRPLFDICSVEDDIQKALQRKVRLKSGAYLIFDQTEAMTTIDVNTGSNVGSGLYTQTLFKTNLEAAEIIARQVRLRNLGGIIIIDFIDMENREHQVQLLEALKTALAKDSVYTEVRELTSLGLVQMTRKRTRESLEHILCVACPLCQRRGSIKSLATIAYDIFREIKRVAQHFSWSGFSVLASKQIVEYLLEEESTMLADLEAEIDKPIRLKIESSYGQENFDILPFS